MIYNCSLPHYFTNFGHSRIKNEEKTGHPKLIEYSEYYYRHCTV